MTAGTAQAPSLSSRLDAWTAGPRLGIAVALATTLFVAPVILAALITNRPAAGFWTVMIAGLVLLFLFALATSRRPALFIGILVLWFALQRFVIALVSPHVDAGTVRLLVTYKEGYYFILVTAAAISFALRSHRSGREMPPVLLADVLAGTLIVLLAVSFLFSSADQSARLTYGRRLAAPLLLYLGGRLLLADRAQALAALRLVVATGLGVAAFGLVERFVLGTGFWRDDVDALAFYGKLADSGLLPSSWIRPFEGVPEGIFSAFPLGVPVRRLVSTFLEPTTLGSFLAFVLLLVLFVPSLLGAARRYVWCAAAIILALAVAGTVSRGAMQISLIGGGAIVAVSYLRLRRLPGTGEAALIGLVACLLLASMMVTSLSFSQLPNRRAQLQDVLTVDIISGFPGYQPPPPDPNAIDAGVRTHVNGLTTGLDKMIDEPLGAGLGAAGGWSEAPEVGSESAVGTMAAQLGVAGLGLWLAFHAALIAGLAAAGLRLRHETAWSALLLTLAAALLGLTFTAAFSESASGLLGNAVYYLFAGWAITVAMPAANGLHLRWLPDAGGERYSLPPRPSGSQR